MTTRVMRTDEDIADNTVLGLQDKPGITAGTTNPFLTKDEITGAPGGSIETISSCDYLVSSVAEFDSALADINTSGLGGSIALKRGTYAKGSPFVIPNVSNIRIFSEGGAVISKPTNECAFKISNVATSCSNLIIEGLRFNYAGGPSDTHSFIECPAVSAGLYLYNVYIKKCYFDGQYALLGGALKSYFFNYYYLYDNYFDGILGKIVENNYSGGQFQYIEFAGNTSYINGPYSPDSHLYSPAYAGYQGSFVFKNNNLRISNNSGYSEQYIVNIGSANQYYPSIIENNFIWYGTESSPPIYAFYIGNPSAFRGVIKNNTHYAIPTANFTNVSTIADQCDVSNNVHITQI